jgi:CheY-like chemotaxis protein/anti-sigma regulatory factor (Ser/Thr protein kinase)
MNELAHLTVNINTRGKALVADDERSNRIIIRAILKQIGYEVLLAEDGSEAVELFKSESPDIILMDVMMPVMDGYDAVRKIKAIPSDKFTPVIFLTGVSGEDNLAKCIDVGGDDFLSKPISKTLLKAKIQSMERFSQLHSEVNMLYARSQQDQHMAEEVFAGAVVSDNVALHRINTILKPAELFSGDVLLTAYSPSGDLNILMGDFTGHGLAAALGAMPASEAFRAMTGKGYSTQQILSAINSKLLALLPTGMFMATQFVSIANTLDHVSVCNCGMPDILFLDEKDSTIKHRIASQGLPLGITEEINLHDFIEVINIKPGDRILMVSDGLTEGVNENREQFGNDRFEQAILSSVASQSVIDSISQALSKHCGNASQADDISLAEIPCCDELLPNINSELTSAINDSSNKDILKEKGSIDFVLSIQGSRLSESDPIPLLINHLNEIDGLGGHRRILYTILTELYTNALDHGVLGLNSSLKNTSDGFTQYYTEREKRLETLSDGYIRISLCSHPTPNGGEITILMSDSGPGFDYQNIRCDNSDHSRLSGRGLQLVSELCNSLKFTAPGNQVEAIYSWNKS